jgi:hypothetical protein
MNVLKLDLLYFIYYIICVIRSVCGATFLQLGICIASCSIMNLQNPCQSDQIAEFDKMSPSFAIKMLLESRRISLKYLSLPCLNVA